MIIYLLLTINIKASHEKKTCDTFFKNNLFLTVDIKKILIQERH